RLRAANAAGAAEGWTAGCTTGRTAGRLVGHDRVAAGAGIPQSVPQVSARERRFARPRAPR
ncbi:hypothetical protein, partial [Acidimangrovimonas sediminis]|uniref:hypothetical protein n=1 Tax=Acidimangrovimonas sediminis TaxID=2056283 RepID=UPI001E4602E2